MDRLWSATMRRLVGCLAVVLVLGACGGDDGGSGGDVIVPTISWDCTDGRTLSAGEDGWWFDEGTVTAGEVPSDVLYEDCLA